MITNEELKQLRKLDLKDYAFIKIKIIDVDEEAIFFTSKDGQKSDKGYYKTLIKFGTSRFDIYCEDKWEIGLREVPLKIAEGRLKGIMPLRIAKELLASSKQQ